MQSKIADIIKRGGSASSFIFYGSDLQYSFELVKEFARANEISEFDIVEVSSDSSEKNSKGEIKIKDVRELIRQINLTPGQSRYKLAIIKDADNLSVESANTILKTLEEPPKTAKIFLLSADLNLLSTIKSRCQIIRTEDTDSKKIQETLDSFRKAISGNIKKAFKEAENLSQLADLDSHLDSVIVAMRLKMREKNDKRSLRGIKLLLEAKKNIKITTNKRLVLENLFLNLKNG